ncbi:hypothetical protein [Roseibium marinum]|uniref:Uncharacterized protein n=1 Tax=Roseibium marinum TaxID=281252 RepID=A0A2S3V3L7_9HYPH|nr:hypothetical protein [Roseibium marinum]POF34363.1 hypothetical protein CLV41_101817 [Roseibium marinum]
MVNMQESQIFESDWSELTSFCVSASTIKEKVEDTSRPVLALTPEINVFIQELISQLKGKEGLVIAKVLSGPLTAAARIFPYSFQLRTYATAFCEKFPLAATEPLRALSQRGRNLKSSNYRISLAEILAEIENHHVNLIANAKYHGMEIWPMLRTVLATEVENRILAGGRLTTRIAGDAEATLYQYENAFTNEIKYTPPDISFLENDAAFKAGNLDIEFLFFSRALRYIKRKNGFWVDGPCDYLHQLLAPNYSCLKIEEYDDKALKRQPRVLAPKYFRTPWKHDQKRFFDHMKSDFPSWSGTESKESWRLYTRACSKLGLPSDKKNYNALLRNMQYAWGYANFFRDFVGRINPRFVFQEFYYSPESIGLILACKSLGIPVIEVQHGLIGSHQWQTTHWVKMPENGYVNHPDYYWVFDKFEKENSETHQPRNAFHRPAIVAGHAELEIFKRNHEKEESKLKPSHREFLKEIGDATYNILFSPQYHHVDFTGIVAVSRALPKDARLLVRLHPMQLPIVDGLAELIEKYGTDNIEVENSSKIPLYSLMERCHHVITKYSTLAREGLEFDMDVTLLDDMGRQLFHQYVDLGRMTYCGTKESLVDKILADYRSYKDPAVWQVKCGEFEAFRKEHLSETPESAVEEIRMDWEQKNEYRSNVARNCSDMPIMSVPLSIQKCAENRYLKDVDRTSGDFSIRRTFLIDENLPINRNTLARIFYKTVLGTDSKTALDLVFHGSEAATHSGDILTLFYGMSGRSVNIHIDALGSIETASRSESDKVLRKLDIEALALPGADAKSITGLKVISASNDVLTQTKRWLGSKGLDENLVVVTFGDSLNNAQAESILCSDCLVEIAAHRNILLNGSRHFVENCQQLPERINLFEPAVYALDAAIALCQNAGTNIVVSNDGWDQLFVGNNGVCVTLTPEDWENESPTSLLRQICGDQPLLLDEL